MYRVSPLGEKNDVDELISVSVTLLEKRDDE